MSYFETMKDLFLWLEKSYGNKEAIVDFPVGKRWSFRDLGNYSRSVCANYSKDVGIKKGDTVGWLSLSPSTDILALSFGARKMGAVPVAMNARASLDVIAWMINNVQLKTLAYSGECVETVKRLREIGISGVREYIALQVRGGFTDEVMIEEIYEKYKAADEPNVDITEDDICLICHTSGTTGTPKPVFYKEGAWSWTMMNYPYVFSLYFDDTLMVSTSPGFVGWAHSTCGSLRAAAKQCCVRFVPEMYLRAITEEKVTHGHISPTLVRMLFNEYKKQPEAFNLDSLRVLLISGEPMTQDIVDMLKQMFPRMLRISALGATEGMTIHTGAPSAYLNGHWDTVGKPMPGVTAELRDTETGETISESNKRGELYAKGPGLASGVWNDPNATAKNFPDGWLRTGDILYRDEQGYYYVSGRGDHMFKSGGIKVYSEEVEGNLKKHPSVLDAVVVPIGHETFGFVPFAHVRNQRPLTVKEMEEWWKAQGLAGYSRPKAWRFWGEEVFPKLGSDKVDRKKLKEMAVGDEKG